MDTYGVDNARNVLSSRIHSQATVGTTVGSSDDSLETTSRQSSESASAVALVPLPIFETCERCEQSHRRTTQTKSMVKS